jgi:hypothetical protein
MNINQRINELFKKLAFLGYYQFQMNNIIKEAIGTTKLEEADQAQQVRVINFLEKYEKLGSDYLLAYSK